MGLHVVLLFIKRETGPALDILPVSHRSVVPTFGFLPVREDFPREGEASSVK